MAVDGIVMSVDHDNLPWHALDAVPCISWDASDDVLFARPPTGRSRLDGIGDDEEDEEDAWAADLEEELFA